VGGVRLSESGGPIPYEIRVAPDGRIWTSELQGNRLFAYDPETRQFDVFTMPETWSGPRRFDIDRRGILWIPAYASNELVRLDPATRKFTRFPLPEPDAVPYVVRVDDDTHRIWVGTSAADVVLSYDEAVNRFTTYPLPSRGAIVRHLAIDPRTHDLWIAYGASPGRIPAKVARLEIK
jgi:virginiamycin B lyase